MVTGTPRNFVGPSVPIPVIIGSFQITQRVAFINLLRRAALVLLDSAEFPSADDLTYGSSAVQVDAFPVQWAIHRSS